MLFVGCDCNYDLCASQRSGDYDKWKYFDDILWGAIFELSQKETGCFPVYSGLNHVKLPYYTQIGYFKTYVSTSWRKEVSKAFIGKDGGMIIEFDKSRRKCWFCCDVSWISKLPDECEILFSRAIDTNGDGRMKFECTVLDEYKGVQTVSLKHGGHGEWH